jgi:hypothetical protein
MPLGAPTSTETITAKAFFLVEPDFMAKFPFPPVIPPMLPCRYNPKELKIAGGGEWREPETNQQRSLVPALFMKPKPRTMTLQLLIDHFELPSGDVTLEVDTFFDWSRPRMAVTMDKTSAPHLRFQWGMKRFFKCYIESVSASYTLFSRSGAPLRATVDLTLKETLDPFFSQNPTSGGPGGERIHQVRAGDTLHSIAQHHYGQPRLWRGIAAFNEIDDPLRVPTGSVVSLPEFAVVEELS